MDNSGLITYLNYAKSLFVATCFVLALGMAALEAVRYISNEDNASIAFKNFDSMPGNEYPAFTFCIQGRSGEIFREEYLFDTYGMNTTTYQNCLMGSCADEKEFQNVAMIDFDKALIQPSDFIYKIKTKTSKDKAEEARWTRKTPSSDLPLYKVHQSPWEICYTIIDDLQQSIFKKMDRIQLNWKYLKQLARKPTKGFYLLLRAHYSGQFYRDKTLISFDAITNIDESDNYIVISLYEVNIIRNRPNANIPCDPSKNNNDDDHWRRAKLSFLGCVPPFWKSFLNYNLPICNSSRQLETFNDLSSLDNDIDYDKITALYTPPCDEMSIVPTIYQKRLGSPNEFQIIIKYPARNFKEILNKRAFNFEAFWSGVGGFVGIFLGYSLMQLPSILYEGIKIIFSIGNKARLRLKYESK